MSIYLGISSPDSDVTATFVVDGKIVYAAQEERFTRKKQQDGFPYKAIENGLQVLGISIADIAAVGYGWFRPEEEKRMYMESGWLSVKQSIQYKAPFLPSVLHALNFFRRGLIISPREFKKSHDAFRE